MNTETEIRSQMKAEIKAFAERFANTLTDKINAKRFEQEVIKELGYPRQLTLEYAVQILQERI